MGSRRSRTVRSAVPWTLLVGVLAAAGCRAPGPASTPPGTRPNVLFIALDDLNDWVGPLGNTAVHTPHLDRLARRGMVFTNAHAAAPVCNPSRVSVLTGLRPSSTGVYENQDRMRELVPDVVTLPQYFRQHGYRAYGAGSVPPKEAFRYAFENGADYISAGMYDFQMVEDANIALETLAETHRRPRRWSV